MYPLMIKLYPSWFMFFILNIIGLRLIISSSNWLIIWIGFELSLIGFLPMFLTNSLVIERIVKYLIIQAGGSAVILVAFIVECKFNSRKLLLISILIKVGIFPFFQWVPAVMTSMTWMGCIILSTIQKLGPLFILTKVNRSLIRLLIIVRMIGILIRGLIGINQVIIRPLLAYSSISHTRWMVIAIPFKFNIFITYILIYFLITIILIIRLKTQNKNILIRKNKSNSESFITNLILLTTAGIPPFSIFFLKITILFNITNFPMIILIVLIGTMMSSYFYLSFIIPRLIKFWIIKKITLGCSVLIVFIFPIIFLI